MRSTRVVVAVVRCHGPLHDRADALADPPRRRRTLVPDRPQRNVLRIGIFRVGEPILRAHRVGRDDVQAAQEGEAQFLDGVHLEDILTVHLDVAYHATPLLLITGVCVYARSNRPPRSMRAE